MAFSNKPKAGAGRKPGSSNVGVLTRLADEAEVGRGGPSQVVGGRPSKLSLQRAQKDLNDRQLAFVVWCSTAERYREPSSKAQLALELGVSENTLWRWSKDPKIIAAIRWMVLNNAGDPERIGRVIDFLFETVQDEGVSSKDRLAAAREFLNAVGVKQLWASTSPELLNVKEVDEIDLDSLSDEEVWDLYNERAGNNGVSLNPAPDDDGVVDGEVE